MNRIIDYENLSVKIQDWIKSYVEDNNITYLVVGVSGGIDSAVVSTLCAETGLPTILVGMPINSTPENTRLSDLQISLLTTKYSNVGGVILICHQCSNRLSLAKHLIKCLPQNLVLQTQNQD